ncbi:MAG: ATP-binding cassette domain-containing protein [Patescibacteria group bacterium]|jgi:ATP-binding cassette subfamily F protein 3|nr:ATP-binding cassette domain-containing protein [Patescibacteria group bacterium]
MSTLLQIKKISKSFGPHFIFSEASFNIDDKQKIGVIGRNGAGKTTLLKMIIGEENVDGGEIAIFKRTRIGYLEQQNEFNDEESVIEFLIRDSNKESWECAKVAGKFQLKNELLDSKIESLSGGYQMRVRLTAMLLRDPNLLLLDEPTNHLDLSTLLLLENFLKTYNGSYLIISHDREFLRNTCNETLEVDQGKLYYFPLSLDGYLEQKDLKKKTDEKYNKKIKQQQKHLQEFVDRFRYKASKATQAQSKLKQIKKLNEVEIRQSLKTARIFIPEVESKKGFAFRSEKLSIGYNKKSIANNISIDIRKGDHIAVLGDNGQGKTTFLKTLNNELKSISGDFRWMPNIKIASYAQHVTKDLNPQEQIGSYLERQAGANVTTEDVFRIAGNFLFYGDDIKKPISVLSGGEKARLCIAGMLLQECNVLLLDEPTNHLDFETVDMLGQALAKSNATILFISHNRDFIHSLATNIIEVADGEIKMSGYNYEEYLHHIYLKSGLKESKIKKDPNTLVNIVQDKEERIARLEKRKELSKELKKLEYEIQYNKAIEQKLLKEYERDNYKFSRERDEKMKEIKDTLFEQEVRQMEIEEELESFK